VKDEKYAVWKYRWAMKRKTKDRWAKEDANTFLELACCMSKS
jgi:hypothetical protein